jgi:hypothetical protein
MGHSVKRYISALSARSTRSCGSSFACGGIGGGLACRRRGRLHCHGGCGRGRLRRRRPACRCGRCRGSRGAGARRFRHGNGSRRRSSRRRPRRRRGGAGRSRRRRAGGCRSARCGGAGCRNRGRRSGGCRCGWLFGGLHYGTKGRRDCGGGRSRNRAGAGGVLGILALPLVRLVLAIVALPLAVLARRILPCGSRLALQRGHHGEGFGVNRRGCGVTRVGRSLFCLGRRDARGENQYRSDCRSCCAASESPMDTGPGHGKIGPVVNHSHRH